ncbi:hypothetical protein ACOSQ3_016900 [Xanthoceras sorbifolium]
MMKLPLLDMHTETTPKDGKPSYDAANKWGTLILGKGLDEGPIRGKDYTSFVFDSDEDAALFDNGGEDDTNEDATKKTSLVEKEVTSDRKSVGESSHQANRDGSRAPDPYLP